MNQGTIVQCIGAVVDVEFARSAMPNIYDALKMDEIGLTLARDSAITDYETGAASARPWLVAGNGHEGTFVESARRA